MSRIHLGPTGFQDRGEPTDEPEVAIARKYMDTLGGDPGYPNRYPAMQRTIDDILRDIETFRPNAGVWLPLDDLLTELWNAEVPARALPTLFGVFERFPDDDGAGVLWSIVHGVENLDFDYEQPLRDSLVRQPSDMGKIMIDRLERAKAG